MILSVSLVLLCTCTAAWGDRVDGHVPLEVDIVQDPGHYLNSFLIKVDKREIAEQVAAEHGFVLLEQLPGLDFYHLEHPEVMGRSKRSAEDYVAKLKHDPRVNYAEQQITLRRVKRTHEVLHDKQVEMPLREIKDRSKFYRDPSKLRTRDNLDKTFNDENYDDMWYLHNEEQTGGKRDIDLNVEKAWQMGFTGEGVVVTTLDDGIDHQHPDLRRNYDPEASADLNDKDNDPTPDKSVSGNSHGTRCAGEIAAEANNGICGVGVAYNAKIGGIRILDGRVTDSLEAKALLFNNKHIHLYSASWGPQDNGITMEAPKPACMEALRQGVTNGRGKLGSIFVWATGNGGGNGDHCGADGYVSSIESISVQSMTDQGDLPFYGERCCSTMVAVPTGGEKTREEEYKARYKIKVVTTDIDMGCVENFEGTSGAAPLAAGCLALTLQANPLLTWRDVQHIVAKAARITVNDDMWVINGAGYHVNTKFGFGMMDAARMVELAQNWKFVPEQHICETQTQTVEERIPRSGCHKVKFSFDGCQNDKNRITNMEHNQLTAHISNSRRGNIEIFLTSPSGTRSELLARRPNDIKDEDIKFTFMTVHNWMEHPAGEWTLEVCHNPGDTSHTPSNDMLHSFSLRVYGYNDDKPNEKNRAEVPTARKIEEIMRDEYEVSRGINLKRAQIKRKNFDIKEQKESDIYEDNIKSILSDFHNLFNSRSLEDIRLSDDQVDKKEFKSKRLGFNQYERNTDAEDEVLEREIQDLLQDLSLEDLTTLYEKYLEQKLLERRERLAEAKREQREERIRQLVLKLRQMKLDRK